MKTLRWLGGGVALLWWCTGTLARAVDEAVRQTWAFTAPGAAWGAVPGGRDLWPVRDGAMVITSDGIHPPVAAIVPRGMVAASANVVEIELEVTNTTRVRLGFATGVSPAADASKTLAFEVPPGAGPQRHALDLRSHPAWKDEVSLLRLEFPGLPAGAEVRVRGVRVLEADKISTPVSYTAAVPLAPRTVRPFRLGSLFGDNMVLQREVPVPVWGRAPEGETVTLTCLGREFRTVATNGAWRVTLPPAPAGGPHELVVRCGTERIRCTNVVFGDVWLCSGQSNMGGSSTDNPVPAGREEELLRTDYPGLRLVRVPTHQRDTPLANDAAEDPREWIPTTAGLRGGGSAVSYFFGRAVHVSQRVPVGLIHCFVAGTQAEQWESAATVASLYSAEERAAFTRKASGFYHGMVHPVAPFALRGVIWYQGESNADNATLFRGYYRSLPAMIGDWRKLWGRADLPFLLVQLPSFDGKYPPFSWAHVREAQRLTALSVPRTALVVTFDTGDPRNLHPNNKFTVGERLARAAESLVHGAPAGGTGPLLVSHERRGDRFVLRFAPVGPGLKRAGSLPGFQVRTASGELLNAEAEVTGRDVIEVRAPGGASPEAVYYAWGNAPVAGVFTEDGVPVSPFRTDAPEAPDPVAR